MQMLSRENTCTCWTDSTWWAFPSGPYQCIRPHSSPTSSYFPEPPLPPLAVHLEEAMHCNEMHCLSAFECTPCPACSPAQLFYLLSGHPFNELISPKRRLLCCHSTECTRVTAIINSCDSRSPVAVPVVDVKVINRQALGTTTARWCGSFCGEFKFKRIVKILKEESIHFPAVFPWKHVFLYSGLYSL